MISNNPFCTATGIWRQQYSSDADNERRRITDLQFRHAAAVESLEGKPYGRGYREPVVRQMQQENDDW